MKDLLRCATESTTPLSPSPTSAVASTAMITLPTPLCSLFGTSDSPSDALGSALTTTPVAPSIGSALMQLIIEVQQLRETVADLADSHNRLNAWAIMQEVAAERASNPILH